MDDKVALAGGKLILLVRYEFHDAKMNLKNDPGWPKTPLSTRLSKNSDNEILVSKTRLVEHGERATI